MAELIAKTPSLIVVDDSLTTLIDWLNIEAVSAFTIIVQNAGGGSGNDITDVQIDTSNDRGKSSALDRHANVPPVPIESHYASLGTFTETAKFVRVRAVCAEGHDTDAMAILLADSSVGRICTLADVKERLAETDTENDSIINRIIQGLDEMFENYTGRRLIVNSVDATECCTGCGSRLQVSRYPIVSVTSIKQAMDYDFDSVDALIENTGYRLVRTGKNGIIYRISMDWFNYEDSIQVIYRGGYSPAGQTPGTGEIAMPADLREAAIEQACFLFKRKDDIGLSGVGFEGGSMSKFAALDLLPFVKKLLNNYRRPRL